MTSQNKTSKKSTLDVGRGRNPAEKLAADLPKLSHWSDDFVNVTLGDSLDIYDSWMTPTVIVSDGGYGISGFEGDTSSHFDLPDWYRPHVAAWSERATPATTLWFWNSEVGWAAVHSVLEAHGWRYVSANIWDKGKGHVAGNVNTRRIRRFPVVSEVCVQYEFEAKVNGLSLKKWGSSWFLVGKSLDDRSSGGVRHKLFQGWPLLKILAFLVITY